MKKYKWVSNTGIIFDNVKTAIGNIYFSPHELVSIKRKNFGTVLVLYSEITYLTCKTPRLRLKKLPYWPD